MYVQYYAERHGTDGSGSGPAAAALKTPVTDLHKLSKQSNGTYPSIMVYDTIIGIHELKTAAHGQPRDPHVGSNVVTHV
jgi:hypothetical protein